MIAVEETPNEVRRWNWGAFFLTWIWGIGNNVLISLLVFVPFVNIVMPIVLGIKGGEWAWQKKRWDSVEHFQRVQRTWAWIGFCTSFVGMVIIVCFFSFFIHMIQSVMDSTNLEIIRTQTQHIQRI